MKRPSCAADGAIKAACVRTAPGANTRWTPLLGSSRTRPGPPSASCLTRPAQTPAALTVTRARISNRCPVISSTTTAPATRASPRSPSTRAWLASSAPKACAARATSMVSRASSTWHSKYLKPRDDPPNPGMAARTCSALTDRWKPMFRPAASSSYPASPSLYLARLRRSSASMYIGIGLTRCGASRCRMARSRRDSWTRPNSRCSRYRRPPWTSREERPEVPEAKSSFSTRATERPRAAASRAMPAPVIPPPITSTSNRSSAIRPRLAVRVCAENDSTSRW